MNKVGEGFIAYAFWLTLGFITGLFISQIFFCG